MTDINLKTQIKSLLLGFEFVLSTDIGSCIYIVDSYTDDLCRAKGVEMKCILIDCEQRYLELGEQRVKDLFQTEHSLFLDQS